MCLDCASANCQLVCLVFLLLATQMPMNEKTLRIKTHRKLGTRPRWLGMSKVTRASYRARSYLYNTLPQFLTTLPDLNKFKEKLKIYLKDKSRWYSVLGEGKGVQSLSFTTPPPSLNHTLTLLPKSLQYWNPRTDRTHQWEWPTGNHRPIWAAYYFPILSKWFSVHWASCILSGEPSQNKPKDRTSMWKETLRIREAAQQKNQTKGAHT